MSFFKKVLGFFDIYKKEQHRLEYIIHLRNKIEEESLTEEINKSEYLLKLSNNIITYLNKEITKELLIEKYNKYKFSSNIIIDSFLLFNEDKISPEELLSIFNDNEFKISISDHFTIFLLKKSLFDKKFYGKVISLNNEICNNIFIDKVAYLLNISLLKNKNEFIDFYFYDNEMFKKMYNNLLKHININNLKEEDAEFVEKLLLRSKLNNNLQEKDIKKQKVNKI